MKKTNKTILTVLLMSLCMLCLVFAACGSKVKLEFDTGDGGPAVESVEIEKGSEYTLPEPSRDGFSFEGWYLSPDFSGTPVTSFKADEGQVFYAKWEQLYLVTLNADGGTLAQTSLRLKAGEDLYRALETYTPEKAGHLFGCWMNGGTEIVASSVMPAQDITLTARYKVGYTVERYLQTLDEKGYEKAPDDLVDYAYADGAQFTPSVTPQGFVPVSHEGEVTTRTLSETFSENVFKIYYDRERYQVMLYADYPDGMEEDAHEEAAYLYGTELELPADLYTFKGYCLTGWQDPAGNRYRVNCVGDSLYNGDGEFETDTFTVETDTVLHAVWSKGYTDMLGGEDSLYLFEEGGEECYLQRGGFWFVGSYRTNTNTFRFVGPDGKTLVSGRLNGDGTFIYYSEIRAGSSYSLYQVGRGLDTTVNIYFDEYNGVTYSVGETVTQDSKGTYTIDERNNYTVTFSEGALQGQTMTFCLTSVRLSSTATRLVFMVRNDREYELGAIPRFAYLSGEGLMSFRDPYYTLTLDGYGRAAYNNVTASGEVSTVYYQYTVSDDVIGLYSSSGSLYGRFRFMTYKNTMGYIQYQPALAHEYTDDNGGTLELDGTFGATFRSGSEQYSGYYSVRASSQFGDYIIDVDVVRSGENPVSHVFVISTTSQRVENQVVYTYSFVEMAANYAEYFYMNDDGIYYAPLVVLGGNLQQPDEVSVYGYTERSTYEKVLTGSYEYNEQTGLYAVTVNEHFPAEVSTELFDYAALDGFVFAISDVTTTSSQVLPVTYWHSVTTEEGTTDYEEEYSAADGSGATLTLVGGFAIYRAGEKVTIGAYGVIEENKTIRVASDEEEGGYLYFELSETDGNKTFIKLGSMIGAYEAVLADGTVSEGETLTLDGKGGATYSVSSQEGNETVTKSYTGSYTSTGRLTPFEQNIFSFNADGVEPFEFIFITSAGLRYFAKYNANVNGVYSASGAELELDGFGFRGRYTDSDRNVYSGIYYLSDEALIRFETAERVFYFDIKADRSFTVRGAEYATYLYYDNQNLMDYDFTLDGYGQLTVYAYKGEDEGRVLVDEHGSYELAGGDCTLRFTDGGRPVELTGELTYVEMDSLVYNAFVRYHDEVTELYVNEADWSVLRLFNDSRAVKYGVTGMAEAGYYRIINEHLIYYTDESGSNACIYDYDVGACTATPITFDERSYYTEDIQSLIFTRSGFMLQNGTTRYYNIEDGEVYIYHMDAESADANSYGYVREKFGTFDKVKEWDGKTYYQNDGFALTFKRAGDTQKYRLPLYAAGIPIPKPAEVTNLTFTPTGGMEFSVSGVATVDGQTYSVTVVRHLLEDGSYEMYFLWQQNVSPEFYRVDIEVHYVGGQGGAQSGNTYEITGMRAIVTLPSFLYLYNYFLFYANYGSAVANSIVNGFGEIRLVSIYGESPERDDKGQFIPESEYMEADFGEYSDMYDSKGKLVSLRNQTFRIDETTNTYVVEFRGEDGYDYCLRFYATYFDYLATYGYVVEAFTRVQTFEYEDYTFEVERLISSDESSIGGIYRMALSKNGEELPCDIGLTRGNSVYYAVRERDEAGKVTSIAYYLLELAEDLPETVEDELPGFPAYKSVTVEEIAVKCVNGEDCFVDIFTEENRVNLFVIGKTIYLVSACQYDEATQTYIVRAGTGDYYSICVKDDVAVITKIDPPASAGN